MSEIHLVEEAKNQLVQENDRRNPSCSDSIIQYRRMSLNTKRKKYLHRLDVFAFLPVPRTDPISTKKSLIGSLLFLGIFLSYVLSTFILFCLNNPPRRLNQYQVSLDSKQYKMPEIAFGFMYGEDLDQPMNDNPKLFTITMDQVYKYNKIEPQKVIQVKDEKSKQYIPVQLKVCDDLNLWMDEIKANKGLLCTNETTHLSGLMNTSPAYQYTRIILKLCNQTDPNIECETQNEINKIFAGGRLFLYVSNPGSVNLAKFEQDNEFKFQTFQYFIVQGLYNRAEIVLQDSVYTIFPDYFTSFSQKRISKLQVNSEYFYVSNVTYNQPYLGFQIWFRLDQVHILMKKTKFNKQKVNTVEAVYFTIIDKIASWGAIWGVLFGAFAFIFISYNQYKFYNKNPEWKNFDQTLRDLGDNNEQSPIPPIQKNDEPIEN